MSDEIVNPEVTEEENPSEEESDTSVDDDPIDQDDGDDDQYTPQYINPIVDKPSITINISDGLAFNTNYELTLFASDDGYLKRTGSGLWIGTLTDVTPSSEVVYTLLNSQPPNWDKKYVYKHYYIKENDEYVHVTGSTAPTFEADRYYNKETISTQELAEEVLEGWWDNGTKRVKYLTDAGYNAEAVQAEVNRMIEVGGGSSSDTPSTNPSSTPVCGIMEIGNPNPDISGSICMVKLSGDTMFYKIENNTPVETGKIKSQDKNKWYTIMEEQTYDGAKYMRGYSGWWIYAETSVQPDPVTADVPLRGFDEWTIVEYDAPYTCDTNIQVVQHVYTFDTHRIIARDNTSVSTHTWFVKNKADVMIELNWIYRHMTEPGMPPVHRLFKDDLVLFVTTESHRPPAYNLNESTFTSIMSSVSESCERLDRNPSDDYTVNALYIVEHIDYDEEGYEVLDIKLRCVWTDGTIGEVGRLLQNY